MFLSVAIGVMAMFLSLVTPPALANNNESKSTCAIEEQETKEKNKTIEVGSKEFDRLVRKAVKRQMKNYPESTLQDMYKSFFQDRFGAGHIIADRQGAVAYMNREIEQSDKFDGELA